MNKVNVLCFSGTLKEQNKQQLQDFEQNIQNYNIDYSLDYNKISENTLSQGSDSKESNILNNKYKYLLKELQNDDSNIIWSLIGGHGANFLTYMLEHKQDISFDKIKPKIIYGYSDTTIMHLFFIDKCDWIIIHGSMPLFMAANSSASEDTINKNLSFISKIQYDISPLNNNNIKYNIEHIDKSIDKEFENIKITGGNLTLIECSLGTTFQIDTENKILFFEDITSYDNIYRIERTFEHILSTSIIDDAKAVLIGDINIFSNDNTEEEIQIAKDKLYNYFIDSILEKTQNNIPIFKSENFGHGSENYPLPLNYPVDIIQDSNYDSYILDFTF